MIWKRGRQQNNQAYETYTAPEGGGPARPVKPKKKKIILGVVVGVAAVAVLILGNDCTYQIQEQEQAVVVTLGSAKAETQTGLHFKLPLIQRVRKVNTTIQGFPIGYTMDANATVEAEGIMITSDYNFIDVDFYVEYRVSDPVKYLYGSSAPEAILKNIAQSCIRTVIGSYTVDDVLTTGKSEIQSKIRDMILAKLEQEEIGLQLVNITIQDSEPPTQDVMQAFKAVETAKQGKDTALNNANKYRNEQLPQAEAEADQIIKDAEAQKQTRINEAEAEASRLAALYAEYEKNPEVTRLRMFYEAMEDVLPGAKVIIDGSDGVQKVLPLDSFTADRLGQAESQPGTEAE